MFYVICKDGLYFSSGGTYVNTSGLCSGACWIQDKHEAFATSSLKDAEYMAELYGGEPIVYS